MSCRSRLKSPFSIAVAATMMTLGLFCVSATDILANEGDHQVVAKRVEVLMDAAKTDARENRYDDALEKLRRAYELYPSAVILINRGRIHEKKGDCLRARASYAEALELSTDDSVRGVAKTSLADLGPCDEPTVATTAPSDPFDLSYVMVLGGAALLVAGVGFDVYYAGVYQDLEAAGRSGQDREEFNALQNDFSTGRTLVSVLYAAGILTLGIGATLLGSEDQDVQAATSILVPGPLGTVGIGAQLDF